jgi:hypothetical protein
VNHPAPSAPRPAPLRRGATLLLVLALLAVPAVAQDGAPPDVLAAPDAQRRDLAGSAVAAHDGLLAVGAPGVDAVADDAGAVHLFRRAADGWRHDGRLAPDDLGVAAGFGGAVAVADGAVLVGAPRDRADAGAAYLFERSEGRLARVATLAPADAAAFDFVGSAVALGDGLALVGAPGHDGAGEDAGTVIVYRAGPDGWHEATRWRPGDLPPGARFGAALALHGDVAVVGAPGVGASGAAYVYERAEEGWVVRDRVEPAGAGPDAAFGEAVASDGATIVVGARFESGAEERQGAAYLLERGPDGWAVSARVTAPGPGRGDQFGHAVAVRGDVVLIGAPRHDDGGRDAGTAFVVRRGEDGWALSGRLTRPAPDAYDEAGRAIALDDEGAYVGVPYDVVAGAEVDTGSVLAYSASGLIRSAATPAGRRP